MDISDNLMFPIWWLFQPDCTTEEHKAMSVKTWIDIFGVENLQWSAKNPKPNPKWTLLGWNGSSSESETPLPDVANALLTGWVPNLNPSQKSGSCYSHKEEVGGRWSNFILLPMVLEWDVQQRHIGVVVRGPHGFSHIVYLTKTTNWIMDYGLLED